MYISEPQGLESLHWDEERGDDVRASVCLCMREDNTKYTNIYIQ